MAKSSDATKKSTQSSDRDTSRSKRNEPRKEGVRGTALRLLDFYLDQSEKGTPTVLNAVDDLHAVWDQGLRTGLGTGRIALDAVGLEDLPLDTYEELILKLSNTAGETQRTMTETSMQASTDIMKTLREQLSEEGSKKDNS